jgi:hypothetical protein
MVINICRRNIFIRVAGITVLTIILLASTTSAAPFEQWNKKFNIGSYNSVHSVQQTLDGGYILAGTANPHESNLSSDAWLIKTDANGNEEWNRTFGGQRDDYARSVKQTLDRGYILVGWYRTPKGDGEHSLDALLIKTDENGNQQWSKTFGGFRNDWINSFEQTSDGGYILAGITFSYGTDTAEVSSYVALANGWLWTAPLRVDS